MKVPRSGDPDLRPVSRPWPARRFPRSRIERRGIVEISLDPEEKAALDISAAAVRELIEVVKNMRG